MIESIINLSNKIKVCILIVITILFLNDCKKSESIKEELLYRITKYELENGHPPKCRNSSELIDTLGLNGNEYYPDYFEYKYFDKSEHYILKIILHQEEQNLVIDSRKTQN